MGASHDAIRLAQMAIRGEVTWRGIGEELCDGVIFVVMAAGFGSEILRFAKDDNAF